MANAFTQLLDNIREKKIKAYLSIHDWLSRIGSGNITKETISNDRGIDEYGFKDIVSSSDEYGAEKIVLHKLKYWNSMTLKQREVFGDEIMSWILTQYGISDISLRYIKDSKGELASIFDKYITASTRKLVKKRHPFHLITSLAHETQHYVHKLQNCFAKKSQVTEGTALYYSQEYYAYRSIAESDIDWLLYNNFSEEKDCNLKSIYILDDLLSLIHQDPKTAKNSEVISNLYQYRDELLNQLVDTQQDNVSLQIMHRRVEDKLDSQLLSWSKSLYDKLSDLLKTPDKFHEFLDSIEGKRSINKYLEFASHVVDPTLHSNLTDLLITNNRLESLKFVNTLEYKHSQEQILGACNILYSHTNTAMLLPSMYRYLTHIDSWEIEHICSKIIGKESTSLSKSAMITAFNMTMATNPQLCIFNNNIKIVPRKTEHFSFMLNNFYSGNYSEFLNKFTPQYLPYYLQPQLDSKSTEEELIQAMDNLFSREIQPSIDNGVLDRFNLNHYAFHQTQPGDCSHNITSTPIIENITSI